ncbi:MAG: hypothetical protein ABSF09_10690, partial [Candidatus Bathyarchaeia archaeon]
MTNIIRKVSQQHPSLDDMLKIRDQKQKVEFRGTLRPLYRELLETPPTGIEYRIYNPRYSILARRFWSKTWIP